MPTVLVIEDDEGFLTVIRLTLSSEGFRVTTAKNGTEGIKAFDAAKPDLVITDLVMPEMEGIETILALRRRDPQVRIIAMSGGSSAGPAGFLRIAQGVGAMYTLPKPFSTGELLTVVQNALRGGPAGEVSK